MALVYEKWFNKDVPLDTINSFNHIDVIETTIFTSLKEGDTDLAPGILTGIGCNDLGHSKERFSNIKVQSGTIRCFSFAEIKEVV